MTSQVSRRGFLGGAGAALAAPMILRSGPACAATVKASFSLPWIPHGGYAFAFAAKKLGYWETRGLDVTVDRGFGSGETCKRVALGQYDYGLADFATMVKMADDGLPLTCIGMVAHVSQVGILSLKDSNIIEPKDMEGKTLGTTAGSADYALWPGFVAATGINADKVTINTMGPELRLRSIIDHKVDAIGAVYGSDAPVFLSRNMPYNLMLYAKYGLEMYSLGIVTQRERAEKQPEQCQAMMDGVMEGLKFSFLQPERAVDVHLDMVKEYEGASSDRDFIRYGVLINTATCLAPYLEDKGLGYMEQSLVQGTQDKIIKYIGAKQAQDPKALYTNSFAGKVTLTKDEWAKTRDSVKTYIL